MVIIEILNFCWIIVKKLFENDEALLAYLSKVYKLTGGKDNADVTKLNNKIPKFSLGVNFSNSDD